MVRDWDVIREILVRLESLSSTRDTVEPGEFIGYGAEFVSYQMKLLIEAGLVDGHSTRALNAPLRCWATGLTWQGHEFLDQIRSETSWSKIKTLLKEKGTDLSFDAIKAGAALLLKQVFGGAA